MYADTNMARTRAGIRTRLRSTCKAIKGISHVNNADTRLMMVSIRVSKINKLTPYARWLVVDRDIDLLALGIGGQQGVQHGMKVITTHFFDGFAKAINTGFGLFGQFRLDQ